MATFWAPQDRNAKEPVSDTLEALIKTGLHDKSCDHIKTPFTSVNPEGYPLQSRPVDL